MNRKDIILQDIYAVGDSSVYDQASAAKVKVISLGVFDTYIQRRLCRFNWPDWTETARGVTVEILSLDREQWPPRLPQEAQASWRAGEIVTIPARLIRSPWQAFEDLCLARETQKMATVTDVRRAQALATAIDTLVGRPGNAGHVLAVNSRVSLSTTAAEEILDALKRAQ